MSLPKPKMRGILEAQTKKNLIGMVVVAFGITAAFKVFYVDRRKKLYADFYKTYDAEAALQRMIDAGLMSSSPK